MPPAAQARPRRAHLSHVELIVEPSRLAAAACIERLTELGFTVASSGKGMTLLRRAERRVLVPHVAIEPPMLQAILRSAGVSEAEFFRSIKRSGVYAKPPMPVPVPVAGERKTRE